MGRGGWAEALHISMGPHTLPGKESLARPSRPLGSSCAKLRHHRSPVSPQKGSAQFPACLGHPLEIVFTEHNDVIGTLSGVPGVSGSRFLESWTKNWGRCERLASKAKVYWKGKYTLEEQSGQSCGVSQGLVSTVELIFLGYASSPPFSPGWIRDLMTPWLTVEPDIIFYCAC